MMCTHYLCVPGPSVSICVCAGVCSWEPLWPGPVAHAGRYGERAQGSGRRIIRVSGLRAQGKDFSGFRAVGPVAHAGRYRKTAQDSGYIPGAQVRCGSSEIRARNSGLGVLRQGLRVQGCWNSLSRS